MSVKITVEKSDGSVVAFLAECCDLTMSRDVRYDYMRIGSNARIFVPGKWRLEVSALDVVQTSSKGFQLAPTKTEMESRDGKVRKVEQLCLDLF